MKIYKGLLLWYGPNMAPWFVIIESASGHILRTFDIIYVFHLFICTQWQYVTSEVTVFLYLNQNLSEIDIFPIVFWMENIRFAERRYEQEQIFGH